MADLSTVYTFFSNPDAHAAFKHRVEAALIAKALDVRAETEPEPMTALFVARQLWARDALHNPDYMAQKMLPPLAVIANSLELIDEEGNITASDNQIRQALASNAYDLVNKLSSYIPEA